MPSQTSKFPSYGLVRGPSHERGGVAGMVADEQPVELEGGEWIVPKEAVPDYLPALIQMTNTGRMRQAMQNGNSAMDALIASASMQNGISEPKSPMYMGGGMMDEYEEGGRVSVKSKLIDAMSESNGVSKGYSRADLETLDLDTLERLQSTMLERNIGDQYGGIEDALVSKPGSADMGERRTYANRFDVRQGFGPDGNTSTSREQLSVGSLPVLATLANLASRAGVSGEGALGRVLNAPLPIERRTEDGRTSFVLSREQGGMIGYEDGGEVHSRRMYNQKDKKKYGYEMGGMMPQYQEGGVVPDNTRVSQTYYPTGSLDLPLANLASPVEVGSISQAPLSNRDIAQIVMDIATPGAMIGSLGKKAVLKAVKKIPKKGSARQQAELTEELSSMNPDDIEYNDLQFLQKKLQDNIDNIGTNNVQAINSIERALVKKGKTYPGYRKSEGPDVYKELENNQRLYERMFGKKHPGSIEYLDNFRQGGPVDYYQEGGQVQGLQGLVDSLGVVGSQGMLGNAPPRRQQEIRNPEVYYGPPMKLMGPGLSDYEKAEQKLEAFMDSLQTDSNINPFSGKPIDTDADVKRLFERMKKSKIPRSDKRMVMREGGPIPYQNGGQVKASSMGLKNFGEVTDMPSPFSMSRPEFEAFTNSPMSEEEAEEMRQEQLSNLMSIVGQDMRIRPKQPDRYIVKNGKMSQTEMNIPKLSGAYLSSFGLETPLSRRQRALLQRKMIAPETLNPQVKGLINRALVQRLANEED